MLNKNKLKIMTEKELKSRLPEFLLNSETYSLVVTDIEGRYLFVNDIFKKRFAFISKDLIGKPSLINVHTEDHKACIKTVEECFAHPDKVVKVHLRKPEANNEDFYWTEWEFSSLKDQEGNPIGIICIGHDITETKKANRDIKQFEEKLENIIEEIPDGFLQLNKDWNFTKVNKMAEQVLGINRKNLLGKSLWILFPDEEDYNYPAAYKKAMSENITVYFEDYFKDLEKWFSVVVYPSLEGLTVFFRDISSDKQRELSLKDSENKLKSILNSTKDGNILISPDYKILMFNQSAQKYAIKVFGKEIKLHDSVFDFLLPYTKDGFLINSKKALSGEYIKTKFQLKDIWFEFNYYPVYDEIGTLIGFSMTAENVDEYEKAQIKLQEQENMLNMMYQSTKQSTMFIDKNYTIRYRNQAAKDIIRNMFGKEAQVGDSSLDYVLPEYKTEFIDFYEEVLMGKDVTIEKTDGSFWWEIHMFPIFDKDQTVIGIASNVQNITDRKDKELRIQKQNEILKEIARQESHELRRPLANILGLCDFLKSYKDEPEEVKDKYIKSLTESAEELDEVIHQIVRKANNSKYFDIE